MLPSQTMHYEHQKIMITLWQTDEHIFCLLKTDFVVCEKVNILFAMHYEMLLEKADQKQKKERFLGV